MTRMLAAVLFALLIPAASPLRAAPSAASYGPFSGAWYLHGFTLEVTPGGNAYAVYRLYVWCSAHRRNGCDRIAGNAIYSGGIWYARLQNPGAAQVSGTIYASATSSLDGTSIVLQVHPHGTLLMTWGAPGHRQRLQLCGPHTPVSLNLCGA
ncbi:MAG TPA: hypothetical protein VKX16_01880 [Chloroflexota bacterium]|nr:hypothetical protein [Chloroflexota bacterium]